MNHAVKCDLLTTEFPVRDQRLFWVRKWRSWGP